MYPELFVELFELNPEQVLVNSDNIFDQIYQIVNLTNPTKFLLNQPNLILTVRKNSK